MYFKKMQRDPFEVALSIVKKLKNSGFTAYFAGGWVRDFLLGIPSNEIDIATNASPDVVMSLFSKTIPVGVSFGVVIVLEEGINFEVTTFRQDLNYVDGRHPEGINFSTPEEDAKRRDFTINGMFYDPLTEIIYDYVEGQKDLKNQIVRAIGNPNERFEEDRLRMIRAFRFAYRFDFTLEEETKKGIKACARTLFPSVSMERILQELNKMSQYPHFDSALNAMNEVGLLKVIFPEYREKKEIKFPPFPKDTPLIIYLLELFPWFNLEHKIALCQYLKMSNRDIKLVEFFHASDDLFLHATIDRYDLAKFYANPLSHLYLETKIFSPELRHQHEKRRDVLKPHIKRIEENRPLITGYLLQKEGIMPGKTMGLLLNEGEKMVINEDIQDEKMAIERLKNSPLWPR